MQITKTYLHNCHSTSLNAVRLYLSSTYTYLSIYYLSIYHLSICHLSIYLPIICPSNPQHSHGYTYPQHTHRYTPQRSSNVVQPEKDPRAPETKSRTLSMCRWQQPGRGKQGFHTPRAFRSPLPPGVSGLMSGRCAEGSPGNIPYWKEHSRGRCSSGALPRSSRDDGLREGSGDAAQGARGWSLLRMVLVTQ